MGTGWAEGMVLDKSVLVLLAPWQEHHDVMTSMRRHYGSLTLLLCHFEVACLLGNPWTRFVMTIHSWKHFQSHTLRNMMMKTIV